MKIQKMLIALLIISLIVVGTAVCVLAQAKFTMKIASVWSTDDISPNKALNFVKPRIEHMTKGRVNVELHKGTLGGERDLFEGIQLGTIQGGAITTGTLGGFIPLAEIFMMPYLFKDWNHVYATLDGYFGDHFKELGLKKGMRFFEWWPCGIRDIYGIGKQVIHPNDFKGKKVRVMETPFQVETYRIYGAIPTPMAYPEIYTALQQGVIDVVDSGWGSASVHHHEVAKWYTILDQVFTLIPFSVSEKWWATLPDDIKSEIRQALIEASRVSRTLELLSVPLQKKVWEDRGVKIQEGDRAAFRAKAREVYPILAKRLGDNAKWITWIDKVGEAFPINEYAPIKKYGGDYKF